MRLTPDGARYLRMVAGEREPLPFHLRWLLPRILGSSLLAWWLCTVISTVAVLAATWLLADQHGLDPRHRWLAVALVAGLPAVRFAWRAPVLIDMPALACSAWVGALWPIAPEYALALSFIGAAICEKVPIFGALFAWSAWPLLALTAPLVRWLTVRAGAIRADDPLAETLRRPLATGLAAHAGRWRDPLLLLTPWGGCLLAMWAEPSWQLWLVLLVAYAQLIVATDSVRLYQQAAPLVAIAAAMQVPVDWILPVILVHWFHPWAGEGI